MTKNRLGKWPELSDSLAEWLCDLWAAVGDEASPRDWDRVCWMLTAAAEYAERKDIAGDPTWIDMAYQQARARKVFAEAAEHRLRVHGASWAVTPRGLHA